MKTWVTYIAALAMGFATALLFKDLAGSFGIFQSVFYFLVNLSIALFIPIVLITFSSGIASIRKDGVGSKIALGTAGWAIVTTILLPLIAVGIYKLFPIAFPVTSTAGADPNILETIVNNRSASALSQLYPINPFSILSYVSTFLIPVIIIAWILGLSLKPSSDVIRPAYTVMNSFSEVMYRIMRTVTAIGSAFAYFASTYFFLYLYREKTLLVSKSFLLIISAAALFTLIVVLPLLYSLITGFRKNPYSIIGNSISSLTLALVTGNILTSDLVGECVSRQNGGAQKRVVSVSTPVFTIIGRGGTGFIATLTLLMLLQAITGEVISTEIALAVAGGVMIAVLASSAFVGYEIAIVSYLTLSLLKIDSYGAEMTIIALLPLLNGLGVMLDSAINNLGAVIASYFIGTDIKVPYSETI